MDVNSENFGILGRRNQAVWIEVDLQFVVKFSRRIKWGADWIKFNMRYKRAHDIL